MKCYNVKGMKKIAVIVVTVLAVSMMMAGCKVQDAPGAYAKAQNPVAKEKMTKVAADTVNVIPEPAVIVRKRQGGSESVIEPVRVEIADEPSIEVTPDPVMAVYETVEKQVKDTVVTTAGKTDVVKEEAEPEVTRQEKFTIVDGQKGAELKEYNVVIGSFGKKDNAERLKSEMSSAEYKPVIVVNERGMFRVILASFDTYQQAKAKIAEIIEEFPDAWCLVQLRIDN